MLQGNIFITGGTGTLGHAIAIAAQEWDCNLTVYSRDPMKQHAMRLQFPGIKFVVGDVRDFDRLSTAMVGHETVIHAAAQKHIPVGEMNVAETMAINVTGSLNVIMAAIQAGVDQVVGLSTDKVCHVANVYGATKLLLERLFLQANLYSPKTTFHLCRYGNVLGSNGSVLQVWQRQVANGENITITDPDMTRFWISAKQAIALVLESLKVKDLIVIPKAKSLCMMDLATYLYPKASISIIGVRPGEKKHEVLLTEAEAGRAYIEGDTLFLSMNPGVEPGEAYTSLNADKLTKGDLLAMLGVSDD